MDGDRNESLSIGKAVAASAGGVPFFLIHYLCNTYFFLFPLFSLPVISFLLLSFKRLEAHVIFSIGRISDAKIKDETQNQKEYICL